MKAKEERDVVKKQLLDLASDRESFFSDSCDDDIYHADYAALIKATEWLDYVNELEKMYAGLKRIYDGTVEETFKQIGDYQARAQQAEADCDALINGIKSLKPFHSSGVCSLCQHRRTCKECGHNKDCDKWTFEYERFAKAGDGGE